MVNNEMERKRQNQSDQMSRAWIQRKNLSYQRESNPCFPRTGWMVNTSLGSCNFFS